MNKQETARAQAGHYAVRESVDLGEVIISEEVVAIIAGLAATEVEGVDSMAGNITNELVARLGMTKLQRGVKVRVQDRQVEVDLSLVIKYGYEIPEVSDKVQEKVKSAIETMTGLSVCGVNITIAGIGSAEARQGKTNE